LSNKLDLVGPVRHVYDDLISAGRVEPDLAQAELVLFLDQFLSDINAKRLSSKSSALGWLFGKKSEESPTRDGIYIWGGVGRGKTFLMDLFFEVIDTSPKRRVHFNDFMQEAHQHIHNHRQNYKAGITSEKDPVPGVAKLIAAEARLLCFDEFSVSDITDAMLLGRLFKALFEENVTIVATSNIKPEDLYKDGLNRQLFMPFIELLQTRLHTFELASDSDYRASKLPTDKYYSWPLNACAEKAMDDVWNMLTDSATPDKETLKVKGRTFEIPRTAKGVARFHFDNLCREPRGASDYLAIARHYHGVMIDCVPVLSASERNEAKRFILLIDILYDNHCRLVISADGPPDALYQGKGGREAFEFERTASRLIEMQSREYNVACDARK